VAAGSSSNSRSSPNSSTVASLRVAQTAGLLLLLPPTALVQAG
jgi:hypothetical protein